MPSFLSDILPSWLKVKPKQVLLLELISGFFIFTPDSYLKYLSLFSLFEKYKTWIEVAFLVSSSYIIIEILSYICYKFKNIYGKIMFNKNVTGKLNNLTEEEKQILRFYIAKQTKTNRLRYDDGVVRGLEFAGVIFLASQMGNLTYGFAYNITDEAFEYLNKNIQLLHGTTNTFRTDSPSSFLA